MKTLSNRHRSTSCGYFKTCLSVLSGLLLVCFTASNSMAQRNCGTMSYLEKLKQKDPATEQRMQQLEQQIQDIIANQDQNDRGSIIHIPVVVHVVYNTVQQNVSDAQIQSQITILNQDFRRTNSDTSNTLATFKSVAADSEIQFCLATLDPQGAATTGITRKQTTVTSFVDNDSIKYDSLGGKSAWATDRYMNLWVCELRGSLLGFAQFPATGSAATDGVVIDYLYFGNQGTATPPFNLGRTGTHEVGHWLNLYHIWGDGDCNWDDEVTDTPLSDMDHMGCDLMDQSCGTLDMVQNYMDYSDDACMNLFTMGQRDRMRAAITASRPMFLSTQCSTSTSCDENLSLSTDVTTGTVSQQASNTITATNVISSGANVTYKGGVGVLLNPGFDAQSGSIFYAHVGACTSSIAAKAAEDEPESHPLAKVYPNPFSSSTTIQYQVPEGGATAEVIVHNLMGREVSKLVNNTMHPAGQYEVIFEGLGLSEGIYLCTIRIGSHVEKYKLVLQ